MATKKDTQQFILLPSRGLVASAAGSTPVMSMFLTSLHTTLNTVAPMALTHPVNANVKMRVLDSIHENGAKLVEMSSESVSNLRAAQPGLRIVPVVYYYPAIAPRPTPESGPKALTAAPTLNILLKIVSKQDGSLVAGAKVIAFTDFANRIGASGTTDKNGQVSLDLGASSKKLERLYIYAKMNYWNGLKRNISVTSGVQIALTPLDLGYTDVLRHLYGNSPDDAGQNITVGVIDTGIAVHPDLKISGGMNTVTGEDEKNFGDNGEGHGTHVAGIIAARGKPSTGIRGLAPGVVLRSYRVFGENQSRASNFAIAKAIDRAVSDGCDLINMSLGGGSVDEATQLSISDARAKGALVIVASGNDGRKPVSFPASDSLAIAVSAMGRKGTFPSDSTEAGGVASPYGKDKKYFIADFSNIGPEIDLTGPGVGIISTFPGGYAALDGTSMACPAVTGMAAKLLAIPANATILAMSRDESRSAAMAQALLQGAKALGFGPTYEGQGLL